MNLQLFSQELTEFKGRVIDAATGTPAAGVKVQAYNNPSYAAMTDDDGNYTIKLPDFVSSLTFSADGYNLVQQALGKDTQVPDVRMLSAKFAEIYAPQTSAISRKATLATYECNDVSIRYITGDLKAIGLKEYVMRKLTKKYRIKDNYSRFYLKYIEPVKEMIDSDAFAFSGLSQFPAWDADLGYQFENLVVNNFRELLPE